MRPRDVLNHAGADANAAHGTLPQQLAQVATQFDSIARCLREAAARAEAAAEALHFSALGQALLIDARRWRAVLAACGGADRG